MKEKQKILLEVIDRFPGKKITVWGDYILDEYLYGYTRRISREAPVLILSYRNSVFSLGGAGNSLLNLKSLGAEPTPVGVLGTNHAGKQILDIIKSQGLPTKFLVQESLYKTPSKTRILAGEESTRKQQILRIDKESIVPDSQNIKKSLIKSLKELADQNSALLISDYNYLNVKKEVYNEIITYYKNNQILVALDSRSRVLAFKNTTVSTPNEKEAKKALGLGPHDPIRSPGFFGKELLEKTGSDSILLTRGSKGMILFQKNKKSYNIDIFGTNEIVDVTGAGDTVISAFTLAMSSGAEPWAAAEIANYAAGIVVMKKGTATVSRNELKEAVASEN